MGSNLCISIRMLDWNTHIFFRRIQNCTLPTDHHNIVCMNPCGESGDTVRNSFHGQWHKNNRRNAFWAVILYGGNKLTLVNREVMQLIP